MSTAIHHSKVREQLTFHSTTHEQMIASSMIHEQLAILPGSAICHGHPKICHKSSSVTSSLSSSLSSYNDDAIFINLTAEDLDFFVMQYGAEGVASREPSRIASSSINKFLCSWTTPFKKVAKRLIQRWIVVILECIRQDDCILESHRCTMAGERKQWMGSISNQYIILCM